MCEIYIYIYCQPRQTYSWGNLRFNALGRAKSTCQV